MRFQTFGGLFLLIFLFLFQTAAVVAQEQIENPESPEITQTTKFDDFGPVGDCDLGARLDNFLIALRNYPAAKGYIIFYRGADELPAQQTDEFAGRVLSMYSNHLRFRRFPPERVTTIDGGFRSERVTELWLVPPGGEIPQPSDTVEKPEQPKNKALLIERNYLELAGAEIPEPEESVEETETEVVWDGTVEPVAPFKSSETNTEKENQTGAEIEEETAPEEEFFEWTSGYFANILKEDKSARGRVIFYADETVYDLTKARAIVEKGMQNLAKETELDLRRVKIIFGGYREAPEVEFWIVPRGAKKPKPEPQERKIKEEIETEN